MSINRDLESDKKMEKFEKRRSLNEKDEEKKAKYMHIVYSELENKKQDVVDKKQRMSNVHMRRAEFYKRLRQATEEIIKDEKTKLTIPPYKRKQGEKELGE